MKHIYPQVIERHPDILNFLPDMDGDEGNPRYPERKFFYRVLNAKFPPTYKQLIADASEKRNPKKQNLQDEQWVLAIKPEWMEKLL